MEKDQDNYEDLVQKEGTVPIVYSDNYNITAFGLEKLHPFDSTKYGRGMAKTSLLYTMLLLPYFFDFVLATWNTTNFFRTWSRSASSTELNDNIVYKRLVDDGMLSGKNHYSPKEATKEVRVFPPSCSN
jgi:hypothetical protein